MLVNLRLRGMGKLHPDWLYTGIFEWSLPWEHAREMTHEEFEKRYELHDSTWVGLFQDVACDGDIVLVFQWDIAICPPEVQALVQSNENPYLLIAVSGVVEVVTGYHPDPGAFRPISHSEHEVIDGRKVLSIMDVLGEDVTVVYAGVLKFLALAEEGNVLTI